MKTKRKLTCIDGKHHVPSNVDQKLKNLICLIRSHVSCKIDSAVQNGKEKDEGPQRGGKVSDTGQNVEQLAPKAQVTEKEPFWPIVLLQVRPPGDQVLKCVHRPKEVRTRVSCSLNHTDTSESLEGVAVRRIRHKVWVIIQGLAGQEGGTGEHVAQVGRPVNEAATIFTVVHNQRQPIQNRVQHVKRRPQHGENQGQGSIVEDLLTAGGSAVDREVAVPFLAGKKIEHKKKSRSAATTRTVQNIVCDVF